MYVAPGTLNQRLRFYRKTDAGADGFTRPVYVYTGEFWGRIDATSDNQTVPLSPQSHVESRTSATATVADYVSIDPYGILRVDNAGPLYFVRGIVLVRQLRCQRITLEAIDPTASATFSVYEDEDVLDGVHLVAPTNAFSVGFSEGFA